MKKLLFLLLFLPCISLQAQITYPRLSPAAITEQLVGLTKVRVEYSRPAVRGRKIIGGLVPYGRIWRVGANESTKFSVDTEIVVLGNQLPAGTYALYAFPSEQEWEFAFHRNIDHWGDGRDAYNPEEDLFRIQVTPRKIDFLQENLLITFDCIDHNSADLIIQWEHTRLTIPFEADTMTFMDQEINSQIEKNPSAQTYYEAGRYLLEQSRDTKTALMYINKAIELGGDTYYHYRVKSELEASLGMYNEAILSARRSLELARELGKDEFVRMNDGNIKNWQKTLDSKN